MGSNTRENDQNPNRSIRRRCQAAIESHGSHTHGIKFKTVKKSNLTNLKNTLNSSKREGVIPFSSTKSV
jgi:hypothetical protein